MEANMNSKQSLWKQQNCFSCEPPSGVLWLSSSLNLLSYWVSHWVRHSARWMRDAKVVGGEPQPLEETGVDRGQLEGFLPNDTLGHIWLTVLLLLIAHDSGTVAASPEPRSGDIFAHVRAMRTGAGVLRVQLSVLLLDLRTSCMLSMCQVRLLQPKMNE